MSDSELVTPPCSKNDFTIETLMEVMDKLPPPPKWKACVMRPVALAKLRQNHQRETVQSTASVFLQAFGMPIYEKHQLADAWMFAELETMRKYLKGELTESDLVEMVISGLVSSNSSLTQPGPSNT